MMFEFGLKDFIDILIVTVLLFQTYKLLRGTSGMSVFVGVLIFIVIWFLVSFVFQMELLGSIMNKFVNVGAIVLVILFQEEIKGFMVKFGNKRQSKGFFGHISKFFFSKKNDDGMNHLSEITDACKTLAKSKTGAIIVLQNDADLSVYARTGEKIDAHIKGRLIENIFFKNTPLHDGAMIISNNRIKAVGCILPIAHSLDIPKSLGLRHRAALGIAQKTDATTIVVSEETGKISISERGKLHLNIAPEDLLFFLTNGIDVEDKK